MNKIPFKHSLQYNSTHLNELNSYMDFQINFENTIFQLYKEVLNGQEEYVAH